jgi:hypothetical protein
VYFTYQALAAALGAAERYWSAAAPADKARDLLLEAAPAARAAKRPLVGESDLLIPIGTDERTKQPIMVPIMYVLECATLNKSAIEADDWIRSTIAPYPNALRSSYVSGPEIGALQALAMHEQRDKRIRITPLPAKLSKLVRAGRTARRWNAGAIRLPRNAPWTPTLVRVVCGFTGVDGAKDDEVDALVSGADRLMVGETFKREGGFRAGSRVM